MRAPRLTEGVSLTSMQFTPFEGFILSRLDGVASLEDIADSTGATLAQVEAVIARLEAIGGVVWVEHGRSTSRDSKPPPLRRSAPPAAAASSVEATRPEGAAKVESETKRTTENESRRGETTKPEPERLSRPSATPSRGIVRTKPAPPDTPRQLYDPVELEEPAVDLDSDRRREILDTFYRLDHLDHYQLLGLERDADKKDIREAYFRLSKLFHPDTLYGKRLGSYKVKMEAVFRRLTDAYEVLGKSKKRERYDDYLRAKDLSEQVRRGLADGESKAAKLEREAREAVQEAVVEPSAKRPGSPAASARPSSLRPNSVPPTAARPPSPTDAARPASVASPRPASASTPASSADSPEKDEGRTSASTEAAAASRATSSASARPASVPPPSTWSPGASSSPSSPASSTASPRPPSSPKESVPARPPSPSSPARPTSGAVPRAPLDDGAKRQLARDLLERRLKGATGRPTTTSSPPPPAPEPADKDALLRGLASSLRQAARVTAGGDRVERHVQEARGAEQRGDLVAAVNSLRLATSLAPEREDLQHEVERVRHLLAKSLAETYERQARYEEENGEHAAAGRSWIKVAEGRPERYLYPMQAAMAFLKANTELKLAKDLAERAVQLAPEVARARAVLAEVFLRAGMKANAKRELDAAAKLDPEADFVKNLRRELK